MTQTPTIRARSYEEQLAAGIAAAKRRRSLPARRLLRALTASKPGDVRGWLWLATVAEDQHELRRCLERVLEVDPDHPRAHGWLRQLLRQVVSASVVSAKDSTPQRVSRCSLCSGLSDRGRCRLCGCVQSLSDLDAFGQHRVDRVLLDAAVSRLRDPSVDVPPRRRHLKLALAYLNLNEPQDALFQLRLAARLRPNPQLRRVIETLAERHEV